MPDSLWPHGLQHARLLCPSLHLRLCSNSGLLSRWCYLTISSSTAPLSFCFQSSPGSGSPPMTPDTSTEGSKKASKTQELKTRINSLHLVAFSVPNALPEADTQCEGGGLRDLEYAKADNAPTIPASSLVKGQLLGKRKAASLQGYILAQTNNVLLEATNLYKPPNPEEEEGEAPPESSPGTGSLPHPPSLSPHLPSHLFSGKLFLPDSNPAGKCQRHKWFPQAGWWAHPSVSKNRTNKRNCLSLKAVYKN